MDIIAQNTKSQSEKWLSSLITVSVVKHEQSLLLNHKVWSVTKRCVDGVEKETINIPAIMVVCAQLSNE